MKIQLCAFIAICCICFALYPVCAEQVVKQNEMVVNINVVGTYNLDQPTISLKTEGVKQVSGVAENNTISLKLVSPVFGKKQIIKDGSVVSVSINGKKVSTTQFHGGTIINLDISEDTSVKVTPSPTSIPTPVPTPVYPSGIQLEKIEMFQDRPDYTIDENPCGIIGNRNIVPDGAILPTGSIRVVSPTPNTIIGGVINATGSVEVVYYGEFAPSNEDKIVAIGFNPGDGTRSVITNYGGSITRTDGSITGTGGDTDKLKTMFFANGCPVKITQDGNISRVYFSHTYKYPANPDRFSHYVGDYSNVGYAPSLEVTTESGCRLYVKLDGINMYKPLKEPETGFATITINSSVDGTNVWLFPGIFYKDYQFGFDTRLSGYIGETPITITVPVIGEAPFKVLGRDTQYYDKRAELVVVKPGENYNINLDMIHKSEKDYASSCWLAGGWVEAYDAYTGEKVDAYVEERILNHPLCNLQDWYHSSGNGFYCEYYPRYQKVYPIELRVSANGYNTTYTAVDLEAQSKVIVRVNLTPIDDQYTPPLGDIVSNFTPETTLKIETNPITYDVISLEVFEHTNTERTSRGLPTLVMDETLNKMSKYHSTDQLNGGYFDHVSPQGESITDRMAMFGVCGTVGENICRLRGIGTDREYAEYAISQLMNSTSHREQILNPTYKNIGIGVDRNDTTILITQNFR